MGGDGPSEIDSRSKASTPRSPRGRGRRSSQHESARFRLLEAAAEHFSEHGFDGTSLDAVIATSGTSKGTLYHHFDGKEDLYATVLELMLERMWSDIFAKVSVDDLRRETFWQTFARIWVVGAVYLIERPTEFGLWRDFEEQWRSLPDAGPTRRVRERSLASGTLWAKRGQALGCIRSDLSAEECAELGEALDIVTDGWFYRDVEAHGPETAIRTNGIRTVGLMWRMLAAPDDLASGPPVVDVADLVEALSGPSANALAEALSGSSANVQEP